MKNLLKSILLAGTAAGGALADNFSVDAPIERVVVYRDGGAQITRSGRISLPAGRHTITLPNLSNDLNDSNRPVLVLDSASTRVTSLKLERVYLETPASDRQQDIKERIKAAEHGQRGLQNQLEAKRMQLQFLRGLKGTPEGSDSGSLSVEDWETAVTFVGDQAGRILADIQSLEEQYLQGTHTLEALQRELAATGRRRLDNRKAVASVEGDALQNVAFTFTYFMEDAQWQLDTAATLDSEAEKLDIAVAAKVSQRTGEDWSNVALALSTTRPSGRLGDVDQRSVILRLDDPAVSRPAPERLKRGNLVGTMQEEYDNLGLEEVVVSGARRSVRETAFDRSYELTDPTTIPATGDEEYIPLAQTQTDANLIIRAVPYANNEAYLFADATLTDFQRLQNVSVTLTRDGHYVGTGRWPDLIGDTPLRLPYGQDSAIDIKVIPLPPEDGESGLFGSRRVMQERRLIQVTNNHTDTRTLEIFDRIPVSGHEDIRVRTLRGSTTPTDRDMGGKEGLVMWRKELAPGETWEITHAYSVTYPEDKRLVEN